MMTFKNKTAPLITLLCCLFTASSQAATPAAKMDNKVNTEKSAAATAVASLHPFRAHYEIFRSGKKHGTAERYLTQQGSQFEVGYHSDISWLIFDDQRQERSQFVIEQGQIKPLQYRMIRTGTGPNRHYELNLDWQNKKLEVGKKHQPKKLAWNEHWLDPLTFHSQIVLDIQAGKTDFVYELLNRDGNPREYKYKVAGEELLSLPYGQLKTIRIERYGQGSDKQVYAWLAPELNYMLVRLWQSEDKVEQFDVQLSRVDP